MTGYWKKPQC